MLAVANGFARGPGAGAGEGAGVDAGVAAGVEPTDGAGSAGWADGADLPPQPKFMTRETNGGSPMPSDRKPSLITYAVSATS